MHVGIVAITWYYWDNIYITVNSTLINTILTLCFMNSFYLHLFTIPKSVGIIYSPFVMAENPNPAIFIYHFIFLCVAPNSKLSVWFRGLV